MAPAESMCLWTLEAPTAGLRPEWFLLIQARAGFTGACRRGHYLNPPGPETSVWSGHSRKREDTAFGEVAGPASGLLCFETPWFSETHPRPLPLAEPVYPPSLLPSLPPIS